MRKKGMKVAALGLLSGGFLFQLGCLGGIFNQALAGVPIYALLEFVTDNDGVFDLFEDGNVTADTAG